MAVELGAVRQIWLARLTDPSTKYPFLIRDDTYQRKGAVFGRTVRLGEPVTLGPSSTWVQSSWSGGRDQEFWRDEEMYHRGTADPTTKTGKLGLWNGWRRILSWASHPITGFTMCPGVTGISQWYNDDIPLYIGDARRPLSRSGSPSYWLHKYDPNTDNFTTIRAFNASINAMANYIDPNVTGGEVLIIATANGEVGAYYPGTGAYVQDRAPTNIAGAGIDMAIVYNGSLYVGFAYVLQRRVPGAYGIGQFTNVGTANGYTFIQNPVVWNNRIWMTATTTNRRSGLWVSDGNSMVEAFQWQTEFSPLGMCAHYGSLYILGDTATAKRNLASHKLQVWRFNGSNMSLLYEEGTGFDGELHLSCGIRSWDRYVVWGRPGVPSTGNEPGLMLYDPDLDAIIDGPTWKGDPSSTEGTLITNIMPYDQGLAVSFYDRHNYGNVGGTTIDGPTGVMFYRLEDFKRDVNGPGWFSLKGVSVENQPSTKMQVIYSSVFDGDIPNEEKVWLTARLRVRMALPNTFVTVKVILDENAGNEIPVTTINYDAGNLGWRTVTFPMKVSNQYLRSTKIQYKLELGSTDTSPSSKAHPEIDALSIDFRPAPKKRRQWHITIPCGDGQTLLDGSAHPLTTRAAQEALLEDLWSEQNPLLFWEPSPDGTEPVGAGTEVSVEEFITNSYRVSSDSQETGANVTLVLVENIEQ